MKTEHEKAFDDIVELIHEAEERCNEVSYARAFWHGVVVTLTLIGVVILGYVTKGWLL